MNKLIVNLRHCYGICKLETEFILSGQQTFVIYAPNGVMKTSFAKTLLDLVSGKDSADLIFPKRKTVRELKDESGASIDPESVFVIEPYNESFNTDKVSTLLVNNDLKKEYEKIYEELEQEKKSFITKLKSVSQSTDCEKEFISAFATSENDNFFELLGKISTELDGNRPIYNFKYNDIFDKKGKVKKFLETHKDSLDLYTKNYESLILKSKVFKKSDNSFGTYQASVILKSISDNSFFDAGHHFELTGKTKITSAEAFKSLLESEVKKVVSDQKLKKIFDKVDKAIGSNTELRAFKTAIEKDNLLLVSLKKYEEFRKEVWLSYMDQLKKDVEILSTSYSSRKNDLEEIVSRAKSEKTDWEKSIGEFNDRFKGLPFRLTIKNREDVLLKTSTPTVEFIFSDSGESRQIHREELLEVLSQGEKRALYLLNIIFEVQARKKLNKKTIFIIDDIADSFDYKNKYAIIEYLNDIAKEDLFTQLIFTHNFDFFRSVSGRLYIPRKNRLHVIKKEKEIKVVEEKYQKNPFKHWKDKLEINPTMLISSIPFVRNLAEFSGYTEDFEKLTSLLHLKSDTNNILVEDLEKIFQKILVDKKNLKLPNNQKKVIDLIFESAEECLTNDEIFLNLENKIVLSIAIRLKAEEIVISQINDPEFVNNISEYQTVLLINKYKELFPNKHSHIELFEQVNLMTPENLHINSFMYEPILDLGDDHLKEVYKKLQNI